MASRTAPEDEFTGFPVAALDFYDDLELDNTRSFWAVNKKVWEECVRDPMVALTRALEPEFGPAKVFRPYRDVRYGKDKTPYKNHQGAFVAAGPATGWYVEVGSPGVRVGAGFYAASAEQLAAIRDAIDTDRTGQELERILQGLERRGWTRGGSCLKTAPRGWTVDHPRIELLRHRSLSMSRSYGFEELIHSPALLGEVRKDWRAARPLVEWVVRATEGLPGPVSR
jgi:uncharacterized protein (TIGR02453 family)